MMVNVLWKVTVFQFCWKRSNHMTDPRRYRVAIDDEVMERIRPIADKEFNRNATKAVNQLLRKALAARNKQTNGQAK
jgi:hypothetical protein